MIKRFWLTLIVFIVDVSALSYLTHKGLTWYESILIVLVPAFVNFIEGILIGKKS